MFRCTCIPYFVAILLIAVFVANVIVFGESALHFASDTSSTFAPPRESVVRNTETLFERYIAPLNSGAMLFNVLFIKISTLGSPTNVTEADFECLRELSTQVQSLLMAGGAPEEVMSIEGAFVEDIASPGRFMSGDSRSVLLVANIKWGKPIDWTIKYLRHSGPWADNGEFLCFTNSFPSGSTRSFTVTFTSVLQAVDAMKSTVIADMEKIDIFSIPIALVLMGICVENVRLLIVPLIITPITIVLVFAAMRPVEKNEPFPPSAPELISVTAVALCIDFSLFLVTRLRDRLDYFKAHPDAAFEVATELMRTRRRPPLEERRRLIFGSTNSLDGEGLDDEEGERDRLYETQWSADHEATRGEAATSRVVDATIFTPRGQSGVEEVPTSGKRCLCCCPSLFTDDPSEVLQRCNPHHVLRLVVMIAALRSSVRNICFSGFTIAIVFACLATQPNNMIRTVSYGSATAAIGCVVSSLILAPAIVFLLFKPLFSEAWKPFFRRFCGCCCIPVFGLRNTKLDPSIEEAAQTVRNDDQRSKNGVQEDDRRQDREDILRGGDPLTQEQYKFARLLRLQQRSKWYKLAKVVTDHPWVFVILLILLAIPAGVAMNWLRVDVNLYSSVPNNARSTEELRQVTRTRASGGFGGGISNKFYFVFYNGSCCRDYTQVSDFVGSIITTRSLQIIQEVSDKFRLEIHKRAPRLSYTMDSLSEFMDSNNTQTAVSTEAQFLNLFKKDPKYERYARRLINIPTPGSPWANEVSQISAEMIPNAAITVIQLPNNDPWGADGTRILEAMSSTVEAFPDLQVVGAMPTRNPSQGEDGGKPLLLGYYGPNADQFAMMQDAMSHFPLIVCITVGVMVFSVIVVFGSIFLALRMVLTVGFTICCAFAVGTLLYCINFSDSEDTRSVRAFNWLVPIVGFSIMTAITLDYDSFLMNRMLELRNRGFTNQAATCKAVHQTGKVISYAGVIMAVAFGSLLLSHSPVLQQFGLVVTVSVLLDAFVVRPIFVPALLSVIPRFLWWPRKRCVPIYGEHDMTEH